MPLSLVAEKLWDPGSHGTHQFGDFYRNISEQSNVWIKHSFFRPGVWRNHDKCSVTIPCTPVVKLQYFPRFKSRMVATFRWNGCKTSHNLMPWHFGMGFFASEAEKTGHISQWNYWIEFHWTFVNCFLISESSESIITISWHWTAGRHAVSLVTVDIQQITESPRGPSQQWFQWGQEPRAGGLPRVLKWEITPRGR